MWETASTQSDSAVKVSDDVVMDDENTVYDEEELKKAEEFKDTNHAASKWLLIPEPVVNRLVWGDIKARRNYHKELSTDEAEEAALDDAWNLVHGVAEEAPCVDFKIMPSTKHILSVMEEVYKQYKGPFIE